MPNAKKVSKLSSKLLYEAIQRYVKLVYEVVYQLSFYVSKIIKTNKLYKTIGVGKNGQHIILMFDSKRRLIYDIF